jgi:hypothetical protein
MKSGWTSLISSVLYLRMVTRNYIYLNNMYICIYVYMYIFSNPMPSIKSMITHDNRKLIETKYVSS